jgi:hypothetical protein
MTTSLNSTSKNSTLKTDNKSDLLNFGRVFSRFNSNILGLSVILYISGFLIENMYLGSLGIVSFDVLRTKYILVGTIFILFSAAIIYPLHGLLEIIRRWDGTKVTQFVLDLVLHTIDQFILIFIAASTLSVLAGSSSGFPIGIPNISEPIPFEIWLETSFPEYLMDSLRMFGFYLVIYILIVFIGLIITVAVKPTGKTSEIKTRREAFYQYRSKVISKDIFKFTLIPFLIILILGVVGDLISYLSSGRLASSVSTGNYGNLGFMRFVAGALLVYLLIGAFLVYMLIIRDRRDDSEDNNANASSQHAGITSSLFVFFWIMLIILPLYTFGVYPFLPQQIGGGRPEKIEIISTNEQLMATVTAPNKESYLLDRSSESSIILLIEPYQQEFEAIQINNSQIEYLKFLNDH